MKKRGLSNGFGFLAVINTSETLKAIATVGHQLSAPLLRKQDVALKSTRVRARGEPNPVRVQRWRWLGIKADQRTHVGKHDGGTEKKQPPPLKDVVP